MTIRHFLVFQAVCEEMSFTGAAKKLYMTQPAVSHAIREMEEETGCVLFERLSKKIYLSQAGKELLKKTSRILELYDSITAEKRGLEREAILRIGSSITIANFWLPKILCDMDGVQVQVTVDSARRVLELLQRNEVDLALAEGVIDDPSLVSVSFASYRVLAVCAPDDPAAREPITMAKLAGDRLLLREKGSAVRECLDSALLLHDLAASPVWISVNSQALLQAAKSGLGIAVLPEPVVKDELERGGLCTVAVEGLELRNETHLVHHRDKYLTDAMLRLTERIRLVSSGDFGYNENIGG